MNIQNDGIRLISRPSTKRNGERCESVLWLNYLDSSCNKSDIAIEITSIDNPTEHDLNKQFINK